MQPASWFWPSANLLDEYLDAVVYGDIKAQLVEVLKNKKDELKQTRIRTKELGRENGKD